MNVKILKIFIPDRSLNKNKIYFNSYEFIIYESLKMILTRKTDKKEY